MATFVKCKACGNLVAQSASACPKCGAPVKKGSTIMTVLGLLVLGLIIWGAMSVAKRDKAEEQARAASDREEAEKNAVAISSKKLEAAYAANELAADEKYKGKILRVSGAVGEITKDIMDDPVLMLRSREVLGGVMCTFGSSETKTLAKLRKGQKITLRGKGAGYLMGSPVLEGCSIE